MQTEWKWNTRRPRDTYKLAVKMGRGAQQGAVYCLSGDLGVGKTLFAKGFAEGMEISECVDSPTFTVVQEYTDGRMPLYHFDVYRIEDSAEMEEIGFEDMVYGDGVCLIEWAERIVDILPEHCIWITIRRAPELGPNGREITWDTDYRKGKNDENIGG